MFGFRLSWERIYWTIVLNFSKLRLAKKLKKNKNKNLTTVSLYIQRPAINFYLFGVAGLPVAMGILAWKGFCLRCTCHFPCPPWLGLVNIVRLLWSNLLASVVLWVAQHEFRIRFELGPHARVTDRKTV